MWRKFATFCLVSCLVCSSLWAFPFFGSREEVKIETPAESEPVAVETVKEETASPAPSSEILPSNSSESAQSKTSEALLALQNDLENERKLNQKDIEALTATLSQIQSDVEVLNADAEAKATALEEALAVNSTQADELAAIKESLRKETGTKALMELNFLLGFDNGKPTYGFGATMGVRVWKGLTLKAGANYMLGSFTAAPQWSLDNLQIVMGIGWEF